MQPLQTPASDYGALSDSLWLDFTKGLGAPFGVVLMRADGFIQSAQRCKHMLGGAIRQAGRQA